MSRESVDRDRAPSAAEEEAFVVDERTLTIDGLPLHIWCRTPGNLAKVRALVERGADINAVDEHDATPVYYCALTGNAPVLRFLLEAGAVLDPKTFVGERVLYAALTPEIKRLLLQYREQTLPRYTDALTEHLRSALENSAEHATIVDHDADIGFRFRRVHCLWAHRAVLAARCPAFERILHERSAAGKILRVRDTNPDAFEAFIRYLYTSTVSVRVRHASEFVRLVHRFQLGELEGEVERQRQWLLRKREHKYEAITNQKLEDLHIRLFGASRVRHLEQDLECFLLRPSGMSFVDVHVRIEYPSGAGEEHEFAEFPAHWLFLRRSEYFRALRSFYDNSGESCTVVYVPPDIAPNAFACVLHHMYCSNLPPDWRQRGMSRASTATAGGSANADRSDPNEFLVEVIAAADLLGYPHVKQSAASAIDIDRENVFGLLFAAACYQSRALRAACVRVLAEMLLESIQPPPMPSFTASTCSATRVPEPDSIAAALFPRRRCRVSSPVSSLPTFIAPDTHSSEQVTRDAPPECSFPRRGPVDETAPRTVEYHLGVEEDAVIFRHRSDFIALRRALSLDVFSKIMEDIREEALRLGLLQKFTTALRDSLGETLDRIIFHITDGLTLSEGNVQFCVGQPRSTRVAKTS